MTIITLKNIIFNYKNKITKGILSRIYKKYENCTFQKKYSELDSLSLCNT